MISLSEETVPTRNQGPEIRLLVISGIPGSGKSSFISKSLDYYTKDRAFLAQINVIIRIDFDRIERLLAHKTETNNLFEDNEDLLSLYGPIDFTSGLSSDKILIEEVNILKKIKGLISKDTTTLDNELPNTDYQYDQNNWKLSRSIARILCSNFINSLAKTNDPSIKALIILDDNFLLQSMRKPYFNIAAQHNAKFCELFFSVSKDTSLKRNDSREKSLRVPEDVIDKALEKYQMTKYLNNLYEYKNDEDRVWDIESLFQVWEKTEEKFQIKIEKKDDELTSEEMERLSKINKDNLIHQLDLILRELIGMIMSGSRKDNVAESHYLKELNREGLKKIKNLGKVLSTLKKLFLDICSYVYIIIEKDKKFKLSIVEYLNENKIDYMKQLKALNGVLSLNPDFDNYTQCLLKSIEKAFINVLEQDRSDDQGDVSEKINNLMKDKVTEICTQSLVAVLKLN